MSGRPHLLFISGTALTGKNGSSHVERSLAAALAPRFEITLLSRDAAPLAAQPFHHQVYRRPSSRELGAVLWAGRVGRRIAEIDAARPIHLVHAFGFFPVALYAAQSAAPLVLTHHNMELWPRGRIARRRTQAVLGRAAAIVCLNALQLRRIAAEAGVAEDRLVVIENGVDAPAEEDPGLALPPRYWLFAGRFEAAKGLGLLLDAFEAIPSPLRPALVLAGEERGSTILTERARALGATVTGWLRRESLSHVLRRAEGLVFPSFSEASPLLLLEAQAARVPVVAHALPELEGALHDSEGALAELITPGDQTAWTRALSDRRDRRQTDEARIERAARRAQGLRWPAVAERYAAVYQKALGLA